MCKHRVRRRSTFILVISWVVNACHGVTHRSPSVLKGDPLPTSSEADLFPLNGKRYPQFVVAQDGGMSVDLGRVNVGHY